MLSIADIAGETSMRTPKEFGAVIRTRRRELGLTQAELAERCGVGRPWIVELENGKPRAQFALVLRVFTSLGLQLALTDEAVPPERRNAADRAEHNLDRIIAEATKPAPPGSLV